MTNKEYITATLSRFNISESEIDLIMLNQNVIAPDEVDVEAARLAMFREIPLFIPLANISEGEMSVSWNIAAIKIWYSLLAQQLGEPDLLKEPANDSVEDVSYLM